MKRAITIAITLSLASCVSRKHESALRELELMPAHDEEFSNTTREALNDAFQDSQSLGFGFTEEHLRALEELKLIEVAD